MNFDYYKIYPIVNDHITVYTSFHVFCKGSLLYNCLCFSYIELVSGMNVNHNNQLITSESWMTTVAANAPSRCRRSRGTNYHSHVSTRAEKKTHAVPIECVAGAGTNTPVQRDLVPIISKTEQTAGKVATLRLCWECHLLLVVGRRWGIGSRWEKTFAFVHCSICICVVNIHVVVRNVLWKRWLVSFIVVCLI